MTESEPVRTEALLVVPPQPVTGAVLGGRYRLLERVGRGGMADVFAAEDVLLTRRVAVKIFRFDLCTHDELRRVEAEMQTLAALHHPGLVTVFDAGTVHEAGSAEELASPYLVMELVNGPNLGQRLAAGGALDQAHTVQLGAELAATLAYVHARSVVHRDVKPANILLDTAVADNAPFASKLTDFGIARVVDSTHYTEAGLTIGTANYLSPEQALSAEVGTPTDIYSLGLVLLECLTGKLAYPGSGVEAALARLNRQPEIPAGLGPDWHRLLAAATERDPANRPTAAELGAELRALAAGADLAGPTSAVPLATLATGAYGGSPISGPAAYGVPAVSGPGAYGGSPISEPAAYGAPPVSGPVSYGVAPAGSPIFPPDDEAATEAIRLQPAGERSAPERTHHRSGLVAAAVLVLAALLTSGFLMRAGAGGGSNPGAPVNFSSTGSASSNPRSSTPGSSAVVSPVSSLSRGGGPAAVVPPVTNTSASVTSSAPSVTHSSSAPPSSSPTSDSPSASGSPSASPSSSTSTSGSPTGSAPTTSVTPSATSRTKGKGRHK